MLQVYCRYHPQLFKEIFCDWKILSLSWLEEKHLMCVGMGYGFIGQLLIIELKINCFVESHKEFRHIRNLGSFHLRNLSFV